MKTLPSPRYKVDSPVDGHTVEPAFWLTAPLTSLRPSEIVRSSTQVLYNYLSIPVTLT